MLFIDLTFDMGWNGINQIIVRLNYAQKVNKLSVVKEGDWSVHDSQRCVALWALNSLPERPNVFFSPNLSIFDRSF